MCQVFVANPGKTKPIQDILLKNKDKLVDFLSRFHTDRTGELILLPSNPETIKIACVCVIIAEDQQFNDEKTYLIKQIKEMTPMTVTDGAAVQ